MTKLTPRLSLLRQREREQRRDRRKYGEGYIRMVQHNANAKVTSIEMVDPESPRVKVSLPRLKFLERDIGS